MRTVVVLIGLIAWLTWPTPTHAQAPCPINAVRTGDMAGPYAVDEWPPSLMLSVDPCGYVDVLWDSPYGTHRARYVAVTRVASGGFIAYDALEPLVPDDARYIGIKPAEPGYIQLITFRDTQTIVGIYRLTKIT